MAKGGGGLSEFAIQSVLTCSGQPDAANAGSAMGGPSSLRDGLRGVTSARTPITSVPEAIAVAKRAREILAGCCIGINDAINGVALDRKSASEGWAAYEGDLREGKRLAGRGSGKRL